MRRLLLGLPTIVVGVPLLAILIAASSRSLDKLRAFASPSPAVFVSPAGTLPDNAAMERLAREDPVAFLENTLRLYHRDIKGYTCQLQKQEFIGGSLQPVEVTDIWFREQPFSVLMIWRDGARKADSCLYAEGDNDNKLLARPHGAIARRFVGDVVAREVDSADARQSGRFTLNEFGLKKSAERTLADWVTARDAGTLRVEYFGIKNIKELNDRPCFHVRRISDQPEGDGYTELTLYIDTENWMHTGAIARAPGGKLIGEYYFRDVKTNPEFKPGQFNKEALNPS